MNLMLVVATSIVILVGLVVGWRRGHPILLMMSAGLAVYFVIFPMFGSSDNLLFRWSGEFVQAQTLALLACTLLVGTAILLGREQAPAFESRSPFKKPAFDSQVMRRACGWLTVLGLVVTITLSIVVPGISGAWTRQQLGFTEMRGMGFVTVFDSFLLLYPLAVFYAWKSGDRISPVTILLVAVNLALVFYPMLFRGVTTRPVIMLIPFAVLFCYSGKRIIAHRFVVAAFAGYCVVWLFRFMRLVGALTTGGAFSVRFQDAKSAFETSGLRPEDSFSEFYFFSGVVEYVQSGGPLLGGKSYLLALLQFVPSYIWPGKLLFVQEARMDIYVRDIVYHERFGGLIPTGFYGESYLNFGLIGIIMASVTIGAIIAFIDTRSRSSLWRIPGHFVACLAAPYIVVLCRTHSLEASFVLSQLAVLRLACGVAEKTVHHAENAEHFAHLPDRQLG
jgi:hypothetical protein